MELVQKCPACEGGGRVAVLLPRGHSESVCDECNGLGWFDLPSDVDLIERSPSTKQDPMLAFDDLVRAVKTLRGDRAPVTTRPIEELLLALIKPPAPVQDPVPVAEPSPRDADDRFTSPTALARLGGKPLGRAFDGQLFP